MQVHFYIDSSDLANLIHGETVRVYTKESKQLYMIHVSINPEIHLISRVKNLGMYVVTRTAGEMK